MRLDGFYTKRSGIQSNSEIAPNQAEDKYFPAHNRKLKRNSKDKCKFYWMTFYNSVSVSWMTFYNSVSVSWMTFYNSVSASWMTFYNSVSVSWMTFYNSVSVSWMTFYNSGPVSVHDG